MADLLFSQKLAFGTFETYAEKPHFPFYKVKQIHCPQVITIRPELKALDLAEKSADGLAFFFRDWGQNIPPLCIVTADCMPIALSGKKGISFIHAGWKGLAQGICTQAVHEELELTHAFIGPSIGACCYEVSVDFKNYFPHSPHFIARDGKLFFDLKGQAQHVLKQHFPQLKVDLSTHCTHCNPRFHSYRRDQTTQRNWNFWPH